MMVVGIFVGIVGGSNVLFCVGLSVGIAEGKGEGICE